MTGSRLTQTLVVDGDAQFSKDHLLSAFEDGCYKEGALDFHGIHFISKPITKYDM